MRDLLCVLFLIASFYFTSYSIFFFNFSRRIFLYLLNDYNKVHVSFFFEAGIVSQKSVVLWKLLLPSQNDRQFIHTSIFTTFVRLVN